MAAIASCCTAAGTTSLQDRHPKALSLGVAEQGASDACAGDARADDGDVGYLRECRRLSGGHRCWDFLPARHCRVSRGQPSCQADPLLDGLFQSCQGIQSEWESQRNLFNVHFGAIGGRLGGLVTLRVGEMMERHAGNNVGRGRLCRALRQWTWVSPPRDTPLVSCTAKIHRRRVSCRTACMHGVGRKPLSGGDKHPEEVLCFGFRLREGTV